LTIKTVTGALYKVYRPTRTVSTVMYRTVQCYGMSKSTVDTGTPLVAGGMIAKTLQSWSTQTDDSNNVD